MSLSDFYTDFTTPEDNGRKIGLFRIILSLFGGLFISYLSMILLAIILPVLKAQSLVVSLYLYTFVWACCILWIALSSSKLIAFLRVLIPGIVFSILILIIN